MIKLFKRCLVCLFFIVFSASCGNNPPQANQKPGVPPSEKSAFEQNFDALPDNAREISSPQSADSSFKPFYVYQDKGSRENHYNPSGFMPNGKCISFSDKWIEGCHSGKTCMKVEYDVACSLEDQGWAGIYWLNPPNNWGKQKGGFDLSGAQRLTFWAKGEKGGERIEEFKMGGILGDYPDSDLAMIGPVILTNEWRQYTIDLRGKDTVYISGGFLWSTRADINAEGCTFYLDEVVYE